MAALVKFAHRLRFRARQSMSSEVRGKTIRIFRGPRQGNPRCLRSGTIYSSSSKVRGKVSLVVRGPGVEPLPTFEVQGDLFPILQGPGRGHPTEKSPPYCRNEISSEGKNYTRVYWIWDSGRAVIDHFLSFYNRRPFLGLNLNWSKFRPPEMPIFWV